MRKKLFLICIFLILIIAIFSGCNEQQGAKVNQSAENVELEPNNLVELVYSKWTPHKDKDIIIRVEVEYLFRNIANRDLRLYVYAEFYDINNELLYASDPKTKEIDLPNGYTEIGVGLANIISYSGNQAAEIDHVTIVVEER